MGVGSSADLLFKIGGDSAEAQAALNSLRGVMGTELASMAQMMLTWSKRVGDWMKTTQGAMILGGAALAGGVVAAGSALAAAAVKAAEYADEIDDARAVTGIAVEDLSALRYAAKMSDVEFGELTNALRFFGRSIDEARKGTGAQFEAFHRMGIGQAEIQVGAKNMLPLFMRLTDAFHQNANATEKVAIARQIFGRGAGADFIDWLNRGSEATERLTRRAAELGKVLTEKDIEAAQILRAQMKELGERTEALELRAGRAAMPAVTAWTALKIAIMETLTGPAGLEGGISVVGARIGAAYAKIRVEIEAMVKAAGVKVPKPFLEPEQVKKTYTEFEGLSNMLGQVRMRLAGMQGEEVRVEAESARMGEEVWKAAQKLRELHTEGKITAEVFERETRALGLLPAAVKSLTDLQWKEIVDKWREAEAGATRELTGRLFGMGEETWTHRREALAREMAGLRADYAVRHILTAGNMAKIGLIEEAGRNKIEAERGEAFRQELVQLQAHLAEMLTARMTSRERLDWGYNQDLVKLGEVKEAQVLRQGWGPEEAWALQQQFAINRAAALKKYGTDLQVLVNSEGWQGLFGAQFGELLRGNEELSRAWAERTSESMLMVRVAVEGLSEMGKRAFDQFAEGMGGAAAEAIIYGKSFGAAMREATTQALASLAAQSIAYAIYSTALGFLRLAEWMPGSAAAAFKAAALFGVAGVTAAAVGRAIAPRSEATSAAATSGVGAGASATAGTAQGSQERQGPRVTIIVQGHVIGQAGIEELTSMINEAVKDRDVRLVATQVRQATRVIR